MTHPSRSHKDLLPISVSMIARNEAHNLPRSLGSVAGWVSEIVVVVNDCTDDTVSVAKSFGAVVIEHPWQGYRDQKVFALAKVTQPWVLALDADEEVSPEMAIAIKSFISQASLPFYGAAFRRKVWFLGRWITHGDWYPDWSLRLLLKDKGHWSGSPEHDRIELQGPYAKLKVDMLHYSFPSINAHTLKIPVFAEYFLTRQLAAGKKWSLLRTISHAGWRFVRAYVIRLGFLDGFPGFYIAVATAFSTFTRYSQLFEYEANQAQKSGSDSSGES
jgi:glycosyltransferase involved in cell wall biosynthesis